MSTVRHPVPHHLAHPEGPHASLMESMPTKASDSLSHPSFAGREDEKGTERLSARGLFTHSNR